MAEFTKERMFYLFRKTKTLGNKYGFRAFKEFEKLEDKQSFLEPTIEYLKIEENDRARGWGTGVLEMIGGTTAIKYLYSLLEANDEKATKRKYIFTRFYALRAIYVLSVTLKMVRERDKTCQRIYQDNDEDWLVRSGAAAILANQNDEAALDWLKRMLNNKEKWWSIIRVAQALRQFPVTALVDELLKIAPKQIMIDNDVIENNYDHRYYTILALAQYTNQPAVTHVLCEIVSDEGEPSFIRDVSVQSLGKLGDPSARDALLTALLDDNPIIRTNAAESIGKTITPEKACGLVVQTALEPDLDEEYRQILVDALRIIDPTRKCPTEILGRELAAEDRKRAKLAEKMLVDLGGWSAVQRLNQHRTTLDRLDELLSESESVVRDTFESTICQARFNFHFAMAVNMIIVATGIALVVLAILQLIKNPSNLVSWITPGATGLFSVLFNLTFNNPRHNARSDLATLHNVNVIFLGFLRQLNEIDATFKHAYIEGSEFGPELMEKTVQQINQVIHNTLAMASKHIYKKSKPNNQSVE